MEKTGRPKDNSIVATQKTGSKFEHIKRTQIREEKKNWLPRRDLSIVFNC